MPGAREVFERAGPGDIVIGWKLDLRQRGELLKRFEPAYERTIADHVTLKAKVARSSPLPDAVSARIVGRADDGAGVEAMVVEIDGATARPDGGTYHITWSLAEGRKAKESNDVIQRRGWQPFGEPIGVRLEPASFH